MKRDCVFKRWALGHMGHRQGNQKCAKLLAHEPVEITHDKLWGLVPTYTGKVIRRTKEKPDEMPRLQRTA